MESTSIDNVDFDGIIRYMNENRPETLILFAWNLFGVHTADKAELISLNNEKFSLKIKSSKPFSKKEEIKEYKFKTPLKTSADFVDVFKKLHEKYSILTWPKGPIPILTILFLWLGPLISIMQPTEYASFESLHKLRVLLLSYIYGTSTNAAYVLAIVTGLHIIETVFIIFSLSTVSLGPGALNAWIGLGLLLGYPVTEKVLVLSGIVKRKGRGKKSG